MSAPTLHEKTDNFLTDHPVYYGHTFIWFSGCKWDHNPGENP